ncbi:hypothetical protein CWI84_01635 [Idiomarina tyrosinivorans]|uniref:Uncharacterized protein n=1 Tax=Idiomarina tyrosinivorans TaxID=1445662 RepID=A0A432ZU63_9GAMM|nr:hypothetical protein [Idiomarina tyrosinivorans]RUO81484.1 hypothetical protein CWI84_01635 [Idiomarina tyrosinivorans]
MNLTTRIIILAGAVGLMFYSASTEQLTEVINQYQLGWYRVGVPMAWGVILGGLCALLRLQIVARWLGPLTYVSAGLTTMGLTGAVAVFAKHQQLVYCMPPLQLATLGIGLYLVGYSYARLAAAGDSEQEKQ